MGIAAVVFDMDGVLIDSEPIWEQVRHEYVVLKGGRWQPDSQKKMMGMNTVEWSSYLADELGVAEPADEVAAAVIDLMADKYAHHVPLLPGAVDAVRRCAGSWKLGLASSSPATVIDLVLAKSGLLDYFTVVLSTEEVGRGKPAPDVYLTVAQRLGVEPNDCTAVEDSTNGLRSAHSAGMRLIAAPRPEFPPSPDALALADVVIDDLDELTSGVVTGGA
ncbi:HAD family hydrolase [Nocardia alba]|uniref:HAD superfamily hydrolase (TIGR01509 family)/HAD superfamily hydrolase (TIGR01549 family) n=1 Tax=Nocardia alba TaxID=225051 RepID=A0A4R1FU27_9NOCA|nr:HAD family phosphatase [Nocardia alba]TCJ97264.1 HAD superfamily hydrolase (TIGR01509 family)/HAD superfamily hydrolase (TIGR01549 family) [Nocardia alba]